MMKIYLVATASVLVVSAKEIKLINAKSTLSNLIAELSPSCYMAHCMLHVMSDGCFACDCTLVT